MRQAEGLERQVHKLSGELEAHRAAVQQANVTADSAQARVEQLEAALAASHEREESAKGEVEAVNARWNQRWQESEVG